MSKHKFFPLRQEIVKGYFYSYTGVILLIIIAINMIQNVGKRAFLAILTFFLFLVPLILADEVSLFENWLFIYISWVIVILLAAIKPTRTEKQTSTNADIKVQE